MTLKEKVMMGYITALGEEREKEFPTNIKEDVRNATARLDFDCGVIAERYGISKERVLSAVFSLCEMGIMDNADSK